MNWLKRRVRPEQIRELSLLVLILAAIVLFGSFIDNYYSFRTFNRIASSVAIITVVAVGQTLVVLTRNIDLSVGSIVGFTAYFVGTLIANHNGINPVSRRCDRHRSGRGAGRRQRRDRGLGQGARGRRDARNAGDLPWRARRPVRRQDGDDRQPAAVAHQPPAGQRRAGREPRHSGALHACARHRRRFPNRHDLSEFRPTLLCDRVKSGSGATDRAPDEGRRLPRVRHLRRSLRPRRLHASGALRQHYGRGGAGAGAQRGRRGRRRRRQCLWRFWNGHGRDARRRDDRHARTKPLPPGHQRVLARRGAWAAHLVGGGERRRDLAAPASALGRRRVEAGGEGNGYGFQWNRAHRGHERAWAAQKLGNDDARAAGRDRRVQQHRLALLPAASEISSICFSCRSRKASSP